MSARECIPIHIRTSLERLYREIPLVGWVKHDWADRHLAASPRVELRVVEDAGLLQHGALLDAEERRVVLCSSNQASERSANRNGDGRRDPRRIAPNLGRCERGSGHIHARTHNRRRTRAQRRNGARQTRGADARARTFLVEVVVLLHDERLRHGCGCGCCRGDARAGGRPSRRRREGVSPGPGRWPRWIWSGGGAELTGMEKRAAWI